MHHRHELPPTYAQIAKGRFKRGKYCLVQGQPSEIVPYIYSTSNTTTQQQQSLYPPAIHHKTSNNRHVQPSYNQRPTPPSSYKQTANRTSYNQGANRTYKRSKNTDRTSSYQANANGSEQWSYTNTNRSRPPSAYSLRRSQQAFDHVAYSNYSHPKKRINQAKRRNVTQTSTSPHKQAADSEKYVRQIWQTATEKQQTSPQMVVNTQNKAYKTPTKTVKKKHKHKKKEKHAYVHVHDLGTTLNLPHFDDVALSLSVSNQADKNENKQDEKIASMELEQFMMDRAFRTIYNYQQKKIGHTFSKQTDQNIQQQNDVAVAHSNQAKPQNVIHGKKSHNNQSEKVQQQLQHMHVEQQILRAQRKKQQLYAFGSSAGSAAATRTATHTAPTPLALGVHRHTPKTLRVEAEAATLKAQRSVAAEYERQQKRLQSYHNLSSSHSDALNIDNMAEKAAVYAGQHYNYTAGAGAVSMPAANSVNIQINTMGATAQNNKGVVEEESVAGVKSVGVDAFDVCWEYNTSGGCMIGESCKWKHELLAKETCTTTSDSFNVCWEFNSFAGCNKGQGCKWEHVKN